jgi:large subunit ribosomal protein L25
MSEFNLAVQTRQTIGKQVKAMRREGLIPAVVYGPLQQEALAIQVSWADLRPVLSQAGSTGLVNLQLEGQSIRTLVRDVQRHPFRQNVTHVDFYAVDLDSPIKATIPVVIMDAEAQAKRLAAKVFQVLTRLEVQALPAHLPAEIIVNMNILTRAGQNITVAKLPSLPEVEYLADPDKLVVRTVSLSRGADLVEEEEEFSGTFPEVDVIKKGKQEEEEF